MRLARVLMKPRTSEGRVDVDEVRVWVVFYDRVTGGDVVPTRATTPAEPLRIDTAWGAGEQKSVTATYIVPRGFRKEEETLTGQKRAYEGFRVQVWYKGELQDEDATPKTLLKEIMPEPPASTPTSRVDLNAPVRRR